MRKYKISWKHHVKQEPKEITKDMLLDIVKDSENRKDMSNKIEEMFKETEGYDKTFTECTISEVLIDSNKEGIRQEKILSVGIGILRPGEVFNRKIGVQESFKDAIASILDRELRAVIWKYYLKNHKIIKVK